MVNLLNDIYPKNSCKKLKKLSCIIPVFNCKKLLVFSQTILSCWNFRCYFFSSLFPCTGQETEQTKLLFPFEKRILYSNEKGKLNVAWKGRKRKRNYLQRRLGSCGGLVCCHLGLVGRRLKKQEASLKNYSSIFCSPPLHAPLPVQKYFRGIVFMQPKMMGHLQIGSEGIGKNSCSCEARMVCASSCAMQETASVKLFMKLASIL